MGAILVQRYAVSVFMVEKLVMIPFLKLHGNAYLLTPWNTVLLEKLTSLQLVKEFPSFYGTPMFITPFTSARHLSLS
jgi:hypothetical protein